MSDKQVLCPAIENWRSRAAEIDKIERQARTAGFSEIADMLKCIAIEQLRCVKELDPWLQKVEKLVEAGQAMRDTTENGGMVFKKVHADWDRRLKELREP